MENINKRETEIEGERDRNHVLWWINSSRFFLKYESSAISRATRGKVENYKDSEG